MTSQFNAERQYYAQINSDGILKIWNTSYNSLEQEYVPDIHLASPCTCLQFIGSSQNSIGSDSPSNKRLKRQDFSNEIVLGTTSGKLLIYSIAKGDLTCSIDGNINLPVSCLSPNIGDIIYSGIDTNVVIWNIRKRTFIREWKVGNDIISAILAIPESEKLLTASKSIKLWNTRSGTLLKTFAGHSSNVSFLHFIPDFNNSAPKYIISGSKRDRVLNCWNISADIEDVHTTASLLSEDYVQEISTYAGEDGLTKLTATVENGAVHIFEVVLNGRCIKPIKPKCTIKVVAENCQKKDAILPIFIFSSCLRNGSTVLLAHGSPLVLTFEELEFTNQKLVCLMRQHPHTQKESTVHMDKVITPLVGKNTTYLTPYSNVSTGAKRKLDKVPEVTLERRLENLTFNKNYNGVPRRNNMAHLLQQGLRSKDEKIIKTVLCETNKDLIRNTVRCLELNFITDLIDQLTIFIQGYDTQAQAAQKWIKQLQVEHASYLISNPDLFAPLEKVLDYLTSLPSKERLLVRLQALNERISGVSNDDDDDEDGTLVFNDRDSSSESDMESSETTDEESDAEMEELDDDSSC